MAVAASIQPLKRSGTSANITHYAEPDGGVWTSVLCDTVRRDASGQIRVDAKPTYHLTVYRSGEGEVARTVYKPKRTPNPIALSERTVTRLVREALS